MSVTHDTASPISSLVIIPFCCQYLKKSAPGDINEGGINELDGWGRWLGRQPNLGDKANGGGVVAAA